MCIEPVRFIICFPHAQNKSQKDLGWLDVLGKGYHFMRSKVMMKQHTENKQVKAKEYGRTQNTKRMVNHTKIRQ